MNIVEDYIGYSGVKCTFDYWDADSFDVLDYNKCRQAYGVCFYGDKIVIGYGGKKQAWGLIGGTIEKGETFLETLSREIQEESNMKVLSAIPIGYQKIMDPYPNVKGEIFQLRYACRVEPYGPFVSDPAGSITKIAIIDPKDYKDYFDWGKIGERIINRALELKSLL